MKKISILSLHLGYGGIEQSVASLANMLCEKYEVEIACCYQLYDDCVFPLNKKVKVKFLNDKSIVPNRTSFMAALHSFHPLRIIKEGLVALKVLKLRRKSIINYIQDCNSDVIISTRDVFNTWLGNIKKEGVLKIGWEHNHFHDNIRYADKIVKSVQKLDYLVLVSAELQKYYAKRLENTSCKCVYIPNCIESLPDSVSPLTEKRLISVGRLSAEKGYLDLLKIFDLFQKRNTGWVLDIIGDGIEMNDLKEYISSHHLEDNVTLHGFQGKDYIAKMMKKSSIYLMSSYTESFGIVLIEAMSFGVPCIAMDSAEGARDIIEDGKNGFLIKNRNFGGMIQKIEMLIKDDKLRKKMGKYARESVKKYTCDVLKNEWFDLIEKSGVYEK